MRATDLGLAVPRRLARWASDHPFRTAGGVGSVAAAVASALSLDVGAGGPTTGAVVAFALAHPAYPAAVVVGLAVLVLGR